jgi:hypothetical protein
VNNNVSRHFKSFSSNATRAEATGRYNPAED